MLWFVIILSFVWPRPVLAADSGWAYPISDYYARQTQKGFDQYIDKAWYQGKTAEFPNQFTGYHTGVDLEIFPSEKDQPVPVFAVTAGKVVFAGPVSGYGGVILYRPSSGDAITFLYGHVKLDGISVGETFSVGQTLTYLGDAFSSQTGGERKHLHFAVYRGTDNYFRGYEPTSQQVLAKFIDPNRYLGERISPTPASPRVVLPSPAPSPRPVQAPPHQSLFSRLLTFLKSVFGL